jgi:hypothetical protein
MSASKYDFNIEQGSSFRFSLVYKDADGNPIDITNWCARLVWTTDKGTTQTFTSTNVDLNLYKFTIDGPQGRLNLIIPPDTTNSFTFSRAKYDLELHTDEDLYSGGDKNIVRLLYGNIAILKRYSTVTTLPECS